MSSALNSADRPMPTGTVTFLFTDIEGSASLAQNFPNDVNLLLERHNTILRKAIEGHNGVVFRITGDAFASAFYTGADAVLAALDAQRQLLHEAWRPTPVKVRMGIHTGAAQAEELMELGDGYEGYMTLTCVQRIMSAAHGGQVLLSSASAELVRGQLPGEVTLRDMGEHYLKGLVNAEHLWQLAASDLPSEFPPLISLSVLPNNLPVQLTSFVGRARELAETKALLAHTSLLTLIGPGGTGKTRLTLQLAAEVLPEYVDGVWLVELAQLADPALVLQTIAAALGFREVSGLALIDLVTGYLHAKQLLLILDNCEHLVETCAHVANHLLSHCPRLKIIASSREALGIAGETVYRVPPLALPDSDGYALGALQRSEAVQLFVERSAAVKPGFRLSEHNGHPVAQICQRLDGIPLALELAAARVGMLSPEQIASRLDDRFRLLTGGSRTALPRQQTLRSLIDWSYDLLSEAERNLFCHLAVFVGGWSLEAAEAVCPGADVFELLAQLVQKSLVSVDDREELAESRYRLLETIRQYARDRLLEMGSAAEVRDRHLEYYVRFAEVGESNFFGPGRLEWVDQCELEHDNIRAALQWGLDHNVEAALRLGGALSTFWGTRGYNMEGRRWLQAALEREAALPELDGEAGRQRDSARAKGLIGFSTMIYGVGDYQAAFDASQEAVHLYRQLGDRFSLAFALCTSGNMAAFQNDLNMAEQTLSEAIQIGQEIRSSLILSYAFGVFSHYISLPRGDIATARAYAEESVRYSREIGLLWAEAQGEIVLARISTIQGQLDEARQYALIAAAVFQDLRDSITLTQAYNALAGIELRAGNLEASRSYLEECILTGKELNLRVIVAQALESYAYIAHAQNQPIRTARLLGAAEAVREGLGTSIIAVHRLDEEYESAVAWLRSQLTETAYDAHWSEGCAMSMDQAISDALEE